MKKTFTAIIETNGVTLYLYHPILVDIDGKAPSFDFKRRCLGDGTEGQPSPSNEPTGDCIAPRLPARGHRKGNCC